MSVRSRLIMRLGSIGEIILRGTLRGQNGVSERRPELGCGLRELVFAQLAQRMAWTADMPVVHGMQEVSGSSPLSSTRNCRSGHDLRPVRVPSKIVRPSSDRRSGHLQLALSRTDRFLMTAQPCSCVVCVEQAGDRDAVAGIGKARLGSCRRLGDTVHARPRCAFRRACADVRLDDGGR
jgi:hypothetical protein